MGGDIKLMRSMNIPDHIRENVLSSICPKWDKNGERIIDTSSILYWCMIRSKIDENRSLKDIKTSIIKEICKNRKNGIYVERLITEEYDQYKESKNVSDYKESKEDIYQSIANRDIVDLKKYESLKNQIDRSNEENEILKKTRLCLTYNYDDLNSKDVKTLDIVENKWQPLLRYLQNNEERIKDFQSLEGGRIIRQRLEEILGLVGFNDGILSSNIVWSSDIKNEDLLVNKVIELQRKLKYRHIYDKGKKISMKALMTAIKKLSEKCGLCVISERPRRRKKLREYGYKILQMEEVKDILKRMLTSTKNKIEEKFERSLIEKLRDQDLGLDEECNWYLSGCMID